MDQHNRGSRAETHIEALCQIGFARGFIFKNPKYVRGTAKELCDVLLMIERTAIFIQVKAPDTAIDETWSPEQITQWTAKHRHKALSQCSGAFKSFVKGYLTECSNDFVGVLKVDHTTFNEFYAIVAIDRPNAAQTHTPDIFVSNNTICPVLDLSFEELYILMIELSTPGDLLDYLRLRTRLATDGNVSTWQELDILATFKSQYSRLREGIESGSRLRFSAACWAKYASHDERLDRQRRFAYSYVVDNAIDALYACTEVYAPEDCTASPAHEIASVLSMLRRTERRILGEMVAEKATQISMSKSTAFCLFMPNQMNASIAILLSSMPDENFKQVSLDLATYCAIRFRPKNAICLAFESDGTTFAYHHCMMVADVDASNVSLEDYDVSHFDTIFGDMNHYTVDEWSEPRWERSETRRATED